MVFGRRRSTRIRSLNEDNFDFHSIDIHRLEEEWPLQTKMFRHYADKVAEARYGHDTAKTDKDLAEAEFEKVQAKLDQLIRSEPTEYELTGKPTEKAIRNVVILQKKYQIAQLQVFEAQRKINEAKHTLDVAEVAVKTLDHRKAALEDLVRLRLASYFSDPRAPSDEFRNSAGATAFKSNSKS